jgi:hypothetical protein
MKYNKPLKIFHYTFNISVEETSPDNFEIICNDLGYSNYYKKYSAILSTIEYAVDDAEKDARIYAENHYYISKADKVLKQLGFTN